MIKDFVPLKNLNDLFFGGWDIRNESCYESAHEAKVLNEADIDFVKKELSEIRPMPGVFENKYVKKLNGTFIKKGKTKYDLAEQLGEDIRDFKTCNNLTNVIVAWCGSTEIYIQSAPVHFTLKNFEKGMKSNNELIAPSMLYAYAAISEGCGLINGTPNLCSDIPALSSLAEVKKVPLSGKDFKTGQTLIKTVIAPMLKARMLGLNGWFSSNILGNRRW